MSLRTLSIAPPLVSLFFLSTYVVAEVNVTAICTSPSFSWVRQYDIWSSADLMVLYPDIQLSLPKPVYGRSVHVSYVQRGV